MICESLGRSRGAEASSRKGFGRIELAVTEVVKGVKAFEIEDVKFIELLAW